VTASDPSRAPGPGDLRLDVSHLPAAELSTGSLLWWGMVGFVAVEGAFFALLIVVALYLRNELPHWPPPPVPPPDLTLPTVNLALLFASLVPMHLSEKAVERGDRRATLGWLALGVALGLAFLVLRIVVWRGLPFQWNDHVYGSFVWTALGLHTIHVATELLESIVVGLLLAVGYWGDEQRLGVLTSGVYWDFVVIAYVPLYAVVYLLPHWG
jgi:cytochrome c oxidase subunit 1/cytochrome c oxidase subunit I+III